MTKICWKLGLTPLVEVHDERKMDRVLGIEGIELARITNRDLRPAADFQGLQRFSRASKSAVQGLQGLSDAIRVPLLTAAVRACMQRLAVFLSRAGSGWPLSCPVQCNGCAVRAVQLPAVQGAKLNSNGIGFQVRCLYSWRAVVKKRSNKCRIYICMLLASLYLV